MIIKYHAFSICCGRCFLYVWNGGNRVRLSIGRGKHIEDTIDLRMFKFVVTRL